MPAVDDRRISVLSRQAQTRGEDVIDLNPVLLFDASLTRATVSAGDGSAIRASCADRREENKLWD